MRIGINFHTFDKYISGVEYYTLGMINALLSYDHKSEYIIFTNVRELIEQYVPSYANLTIRNIKGLGTRTQRILWEHLQLPRLAARERLDILHCPSYICPVIANHIPYVVTVHDTIAVDHPRWCKPFNALYFNLVMKIALRSAKQIIAVSQCTSDDIKRNIPSIASKISMIYPGIDRRFNASENPNRNTQIMIRYNLPERFILYVGNLEPKKNLSVLLSAFLSLQNRTLPHKLVIVGQRSWGSKFQWKKLLHKIAKENIVFTGYIPRDDLPEVYRMAEVFLFPSLYEGFGFPPLEAMACGVPVIASNRGALAETLADAAFTIDPEDPRQIADAIFQMVTKSSLREKYIRLGYKRSKQFGWEKAAVNLLNVYKKLKDNNG